MYIDATSSLDAQGIYDDLLEKKVYWNAREIIETSVVNSLTDCNRVSLAQKEAVSMIYKTTMASCAIRRRKGDEEIEIRVEVDTRKEKPAPPPPKPEKPK